MCIRDRDGTVLYDNKADISKMENHSDRAEFIDAMKEGYGESVRYSDTLAVKTIYIAKQLENGEVLRIANTQYTVAAVMAGLAYPAIIAVLVLFCLLYTSRCV